MTAIEFTKEDLEKIIETHTLVKHIKEALDNKLSTCLNCIEDHEKRLLGVESWKDQHIGEEVGKAKAIAAEIGSKEGAKSGGIVAGIFSGALIVLKLFGII